MPITEEHINHFREHGYTIVENFLEPDELARARDEIEEYVPGWLGYAANPDGNRPEGWDQAPTAVCSYKHYADEIHWPLIYSREVLPRALVFRCTIFVIFHVSTE